MGLAQATMNLAHKTLMTNTKSGHQLTHGTLKIIHQSVEKLSELFTNLSNYKKEFNNKNYESAQKMSKDIKEIISIYPNLIGNAEKFQNQTLNEITEVFTLLHKKKFLNYIKTNKPEEFISIKQFEDDLMISQDHLKKNIRREARGKIPSFIKKLFIDWRIVAPIFSDQDLLTKESHRIAYYAKFNAYEKSKEQLFKEIESAEKYADFEATLNSFIEHSKSRMYLSSQLLEILNYELANLNGYLIKNQSIFNKVKVEMNGIINEIRSLFKKELRDSSIAKKSIAILKNLLEKLDVKVN